MFEKLKHTFKQTAIYSLGNISTKLIGIILLPIYTNPSYLSVKEYGVWTTLEVTSQIIIGVLALNLPLAMLRWSSSEKDSKKIKSVVFTTIFALAVIIFVSLLFLLPNSAYFSRLIFGHERFAEYFTLLFVYSAVGIYNGVPLNILRIREKSVRYVILTSLKFAVILGLNIYFVVYENLGVIGIIKGQLLGEIFLAVATLPNVLKSVTPRIDFTTLKEMLRYGAPLVFSSIASFIFSFGDRYILLHYLDEAKVGIYSLGYKIASVMNMLILQSFQLGFPPIAYKKLGEKDAPRFFGKVLTYYAVVLVFAALGLSLFGKEIIEIFSRNPKYLAASGVIPVISLAFVLKGIQYNFALSFHYSKKTVYNAIIVIITAISSLTLNFVLIPRIGFAGAAYSMLLSIAIMAALSYFFGKKVYRVPYETKRLAKIVFTGVFLYALGSFTNEFSFFGRIAIKSVLIILFPVALYFTGLLEKAETEKIKELLHRK